MSLFYNIGRALYVICHPLRTADDLDLAEAQNELLGIVSGNLLEASAIDAKRVKDLEIELSSMQIAVRAAKNETEVARKAYALEVEAMTATEDQLNTLTEQLAMFKEISGAKDDVIDEMQARFTRIAECERPGSNGTVRKMARIARYEFEHELKAVA